jgi:hypothetical protein
LVQNTARTETGINKSAGHELAISIALAIAGIKRSLELKYGRHFEGVTRLTRHSDAQPDWFPATDIHGINSTSIVATAPGAASFGLVDVTVTNPDGRTGTLASACRFKDITSPVLTPHLSGTMGNNGWYIGPVVVSWDVTDPESAIIRSNCGPYTYYTDSSSIESWCTADSDGGHSATFVRFKIDSAPPQITNTVPGNGTTHYAIGQQIAASYSCSEPSIGSGVAQYSGTIPVGAYLDTSRPGTFPFSVTTRDLAGNQYTYSGTYTVDKNDPGAVWPAPVPIPYGTPLGSTQLNASANVPGAFTYTPTAGTVLPARDHALSVTFVPNDSANYSTVTKTVTLTVQKIAPVLTWAAPANIA